MQGARIQRRGSTAGWHASRQVGALTRAEAALETPTRREDFIIIFKGCLGAKDSAEPLIQPVLYPWFRGRSIWAAIGSRSGKCLFARGGRGNGGGRPLTLMPAEVEAPALMPTQVEVLALMLSLLSSCMAGHGGRVP